MDLAEIMAESRLTCLFAIRSNLCAGGPAGPAANCRTVTCLTAICTHLKHTAWRHGQRANSGLCQLTALNTVFSQPGLMIKIPANRPAFSPLTAARYATMATGSAVRTLAAVAKIRPAHF
jgi:hypothetical protein